LAATPAIGRTAARDAPGDGFRCIVRLAGCRRLIAQEDALRHLIVAALAAAIPIGVSQTPPREKVILDTDFTTTGDDGMVGIMAAQLHAQGIIELLGITVVAGNEWLPQEVADALRAVERLGIAGSVGVYAGARYPLVHDYRNMAQERALWGVGGSWYRRPEPAEGALVAPFDGFAATTRVQQQHAATFIVDTVKKYPHQVTLLAIGPLTNLALAIRMHPEIVPLIKRIVYMGGAFEVAGNTTPAAEMNVWYDPEAARIVIREPIDQAFIPLDVTNTVPLGKALFDRITADSSSITTRLLKQSGFGRRLERDPAATTYIYDTLALAYLIDPAYATDVVEMWVDVEIAWGPSYGRTLGYRQQPPAKHLQKVKVVRRFDNDRFYRLYADLMTHPVPVQR
jgi:inosine-uridine nucleoside N-ribohydrolase